MRMREKIIAFPFAVIYNSFNILGLPVVYDLNVYIYLM